MFTTEIQIKHEPKLMYLTTMQKDKESNDNKPVISKHFFFNIKKILVNHEKKTSLIKMQITVKVNEDIQIDVHMKQIRYKICRGIKVLLHNKRWGMNLYLLLCTN